MCPSRTLVSILCVFLTEIKCFRVSDVTGAGNNGEISRLHESVPNRERRRKSAVSLSRWAAVRLRRKSQRNICGALIKVFPVASGASHRRGFPEDPEGGGEEEEERGEEERDQERPSHLPLSHWAIAPHLGESTSDQVQTEQRVRSQGRQRGSKLSSLVNSQVLRKRAEPPMWHKKYRGGRS